MPRTPGARRGVARRPVPPALETSLRTPPRIILAPGLTVHAQIEDWLAGAIAQSAGIWTLLPFTLLLAVIQSLVWRQLSDQVDQRRVLTTGP